MKTPQQKAETQTALNDEFKALVKQLEQINGRGEKTVICALLGIQPRQGTNLFSGKNNAKSLYIRLLQARLRNAIGE